MSCLLLNRFHSLNRFIRVGAAIPHIDKHADTTDKAVKFITPFFYFGS